jgi:hypothetical protein
MYLATRVLKIALNDTTGATMKEVYIPDRYLILISDVYDDPRGNLHRYRTSS